MQFQIKNSYSYKHTNIHLHPRPLHKKTNAEMFIYCFSKSLYILKTFLNIHFFRRFYYFQSLFSLTTFGIYHWCGYKIFFSYVVCLWLLTIIWLQSWGLNLNFFRVASFELSQLLHTSLLKAKESTLNLFCKYIKQKKILYGWWWSTS